MARDLGRPLDPALRAAPFGGRPAAGGWGFRVEQATGSVNMYIYIYTYIHVGAYTYVYIHVCVCMYADVCICLFVFTHVLTYITN